MCNGGPMKDQRSLSRFAWLSVAAAIVTISLKASAYLVMKRLTLPVKATWTYNALLVLLPLSEITSSVCRLYVHVTVFGPAREAEVIIIQHVTEIYGRENGWGTLTYYKLGVV